MNLFRRNEWKHIWRILTFSSRHVFEEIRPPETPILVPAIFVFSLSILVLLVLCFTTGLRPTTTLLGETQLIEALSLRTLLFVIGLTPVMFFYICTLVLLATYYFAVARCSQIDILWEHWLGFAHWTVVPMILAPGARMFIDIYSFTGVPTGIIGVAVIVLCFILPTVWSICLTFQGLRIWTAKGNLYCVVVSLVPYILYVLGAIPDIIAMYYK